MIGTGSSGVQVIPQLAKQAEHVFVFQRTAQYAIPAHNRPLDDDTRNSLKGSVRERQAYKRSTRMGMSHPPPEVSSALEVDAAERTDILEASWQRGGLAFAGTFDDISTNAESNQYAAEFVRDKMRAKIESSEVADTLLDINHAFGARRPIVDIDYVETYNRDNVTLVDVGAAPITEITPRGLRTTGGHYDLEVLVYATGFDGMTGALLSMDICGIGGLALRDKWAGGASTYMGLVVSGFPNLFMITGPGSPAVFSNVILSIEQHVDWIADCLADMVEHSLDRIDADPEAEAQWTRQIQELAARTVRRQDELVVDGGEHRGQAAGRQHVSGRSPQLPGHLRRDRRQRLPGLRAQPVTQQHNRFPVALGGSVPAAAGRLASTRGWWRA